MVFLVLAAQHGRQSGREIAIGDVGNEAQPALVDANQWHAQVRQLAADAQHGAVAAHHQRQVTLGAYARHIEHGVTGDAHVMGSVVLKNHLAALRM